MSVAATTRGRPLVALAVVLGGWVAARALLWDAAAVSAPFGVGETIAGPHRSAPPGADPDASRSASARRDRRSAGSTGAVPTAERFAVEPGWRPPPARPVRVYPAAPAPSFDLRSEPPGSFSPLPRTAAMAFDARGLAASDTSVASRARRVPVRVAAGHQLLWMAALARMPFPMGAVAREMEEIAPRPFFPANQEPSSQRRWSADGWLLLRRGGDGPLAPGAVPATYGASQMGAVLRYRLSAESARRPAAYLRANSALNGTAEREAAIGLSARPFASLPVVAAVELRARDRQGLGLRPAALAYTEVPPFSLPLGARGEFYAQAGYVGGKASTPFADGQIRLDKRIVRFGRAEVRVGAGGWAGAQEGASRVDAGPTAIVGMPLSDSASARLGLDWRFRVAGNASPRSGPALTLSAGF